MRAPFILLALAAACIAAPLHAQPEPSRPPLPRGADPNDWEAYFDEGAKQFDQFPGRAGAAFYWAARLDPTRAEPLFGQWAAFFAQDHGKWLSYVEEEERILRQPEMVANQALKMRAYYRNPFVHRGFEALLWSRLGRQLRWNGAARAFMDYGRAEFDEAADGFGRSVRANPVRNAHLRYWRALAFVGGSRLDSAAVELTELLAVLRTEDEVRVGDYYESKAMLEYALGRLHDAGGRPAEARRAYERALEEDLTMYPARAALARMAVRERRPDEAVEHLAQVVEIAPDDAVMHFEHGNALVAAGRHGDAVGAYLRATQLEPHWADAYLRLGLALDQTGQTGKAVSTYRAYVQRAPRRHAAELQHVTQRLAALAPGS